jgi:hypothetical protein
LCCASGSPAAAVSSEPRLAACRRCAGQGARAPGPTLARRACRQVSSSRSIADAGCRAIEKRLNVRR